MTNGRHADGHGRANGLDWCRPAATARGALLGGEWWIDDSQACDEDCGLPAGELVPVGCVREWLGEHRAGDDDVDRRGVWPDGPVTPSASEDLLEKVA